MIARKWTVEYTININRWLFFYSLLSRTYIKLPFTAQAKPEIKHFNAQLCCINSFTVKLPANTNIIPQRVQLNS